MTGERARAWAPAVNAFFSLVVTVLAAFILSLMTHIQRDIGTITQRTSANSQTNVVQSENIQANSKALNTMAGTMSQIIQEQQSMSQDVRDLRNREDNQSRPSHG